MAVLVVLMSSVGCGLVKSMTQLEARTHTRLSSCPKKSVKTEVVREIEPPAGFTYQALVSATGCGQTALYMCTVSEKNPFVTYSCTRKGK